MTAVSDPRGGNGRGGGGWGFAPWIAVATVVILAVFAIGERWAMSGEVEDARAALAVAQRAKEDAERQVGVLQARYAKAASERDAYAKVSLDGFLADYEKLLNDLKQASDAYDKAKGVSGEDGEALRRNAAERFTTASAAFFTFIVRWRQVAKALDNLLDGNATALDEAQRKNDIETMRQRTEILFVTFPSLRQPLEVQLRLIRDAP